MRPSTLLCALLAVSACVVGCGDSVTRSPPPPPPDVLIGDFVVGDYTTTLDVEDVPGFPGNAGTWSIAFTSAGGLRVTRNGSFVASGSFRVIDDLIHWTDAGGPCPGALATGTYRWSIDGTTLTFQVMDDPCEIRASVLTGGPWTRM